MDSIAIGTLIVRFLNVLSYMRIEDNIIKIIWKMVEAIYDTII